MDYTQPLEVLWDYLQMHQRLKKADVIVGFGSIDDYVATRAAKLYLRGYAPKILFTGGLGRNTKELFSQSEASLFADIAVAVGVPRGDILIEDKSTNTKENILFTRKLLEENNISHGHILGVHKPFMERRIYAAMGVYWPEQSFSVTSTLETVLEYLACAKGHGMSERAAVSVVVGDFQRIDLYAKLGYQLPQEIPQEAWDAYYKLIAMGYDEQQAK